MFITSRRRLHIACLPSTVLKLFMTNYEGQGAFPLACLLWINISTLEVHQSLATAYGADM